MAGLTAALGTAARRLRERQRRAVAGDRQSGFSLVELIVAMSIFAVILAIFGITLVNFSSATARTAATSDQSTTARTVYNLFDKQVRAADAINRPVLVGTNYYLEFENTTVNPGICIQWVDRTATNTLAYRQWAVSATTVVAGAWQTVATTDVNTTSGGQPPFQFAPATTADPFQQLTINLQFKQANGAASATVVTSTFTAANSSTSSKSNPDLDGNGVSDSPVCQNIATFQPTS
jgi:prepilin-type N-terminal cleavage/methylation domain-containing protein